MGHVPACLSGVLLLGRPRGKKLVSLSLARQWYSLRSPLVRLTSGELADQVPASKLCQSFGVKHAKYPAGVRTCLGAFCHQLHTNKSRHSPTPSLQSSTRLISLAQIAWLFSQSGASRCASLEEPDRAAPSLLLLLSCSRADPLAVACHHHKNDDA